MQYLNTPTQGSEAFPAHLLTGRQLWDATPVEASLYEVSERWAWQLREHEPGREVLLPGGTTTHPTTLGPSRLPNIPASKTLPAGDGTARALSWRPQYLGSTWCGWTAAAVQPSGTGATFALLGARRFEQGTMG